MNFGKIFFAKPTQIVKNNLCTYENINKKSIKINLSIWFFFRLTLFISIFYIFLTLNNASVTAEVITVDDSNWSDILHGEWMIEL